MARTTRKRLRLNFWNRIRAVNAKRTRIVRGV